MRLPSSLTIFLFFSFLLISFPPDALVHAAIESFRNYQRQCFENVSPCIMFMDDEKAYGCAQCGTDSRTGLIRHITQEVELTRFLDPDNERRILMMPEFIFFKTENLELLAEAENVAAVVVYKQEPDSQAPGNPPISISSVEFSTDFPEPNERYNYYGKESKKPSEYNRNQYGSSAKYRMYPFNIFRINSTVALTILGRLQNFTDETATGGLEDSTETRSRGPTAPRYKLQSMGQMYSCPTFDEEENDENGLPPTEDGNRISEKANSTVCLENRTCLPIGGHSVWSALGHVEDIEDPVKRKERPILAITAPIDSNAFFPDLARGASAEISSLAVMMLVAKTVGEYSRSSERSDRMMMVQPVYFAWNAQSWGYAGSGRFLKDLKDFSCEEGNQKSTDEGLIRGCTDKYMRSLKFLELKDATFTVLNLDQMTSPDPRGNQQASFNFYKQGSQVFSNTSSERLSSLLNALDNAFADYKVSDIERLDLSNSRTKLTPIDGSQSFRRYMESAEVVSISGYAESFQNPLFHSIFDNMTLITQYGPVVAAANAIARAVIVVVFGDTSAEPILIQEADIRELLACFTGSWKSNPCEVGKAFISEDIDDDKVKPGNYPGSFFPDSRLEDANVSAYAKLSFIQRYLAYYNRYDMGDSSTCQSDDDCKEYETDLNKISAENDKYIRLVYCAKKKCVASDTYTHNAFGPGLESDNKAQTSFKVSTPIPHDFPPENPTEPQEAVWTESVWDFDFGLCGFVEDTLLFGGLILGAGLAVLVLSLTATIWFDRIMFKSIEEDIVLPEAQALREAQVFPDGGGNSPWPNQEALSV